MINKYANIPAPAELPPAPPTKIQCVVKIVSHSIFTILLNSALSSLMEYFSEKFLFQPDFPVEMRKRTVYISNSYLNRTGEIIGIIGAIPHKKLSIKNL